MRKVYLKSEETVECVRKQSKRFDKTAIIMISNYQQVQLSNSNLYDEVMISQDDGAKDLVS